jgi:endonuclease III
VSALLAGMLDRLQGCYGEIASPAPSDPYALVIYLNCGYPASDERCAKGFAALTASVGLEPDAILGADLAALTELMRPGGMVPEVRAGRLREIAAVVRDDLGGDLHGALAADPGRARRLLGRFPTIGETAADRILLFCGLSPEPAPPTAALQVLTRLGLAEEGKDFTATYRSARAAIASGTPEDFATRQRAYLLLKAHSHGLCKGSAPTCEPCPLTADCAWFQAHAAG